MKNTTATRSVSFLHRSIGNFKMQLVRVILELLAGFQNPVCRKLHSTVPKQELERFKHMGNQIQQQRAVKTMEFWRLDVQSTGGLKF